MKLLFSYKPLAFFFLFFLSLPVLAQRNQDNEKLAREYFQQGDFAKAEIIYEALITDDSRFARVYPEYLKTLLALKKYRDAEKLVKQTIKRVPNNPDYEIDLGIVYNAAGKTDDSKKQFDKIISQVTQPKVRATAQAFAQKDLPKYVEKTYLQGRK